MLGGDSGQPWARDGGQHWVGDGGQCWVGDVAQHRVSDGGQHWLGDSGQPWALGLAPDAFPSRQALEHLRCSTLESRRNLGADPVSQ